MLDRASYQTAIAMLSDKDRVGKLELVLDKFWLLVTRAGPGHKPTEDVGFAIYRQLHMRSAKSLMMSDELEDFDEDEERKSSGEDWTEDCKRYGLQANGALTMTMFYDSMYQLVDLWAGEANVNFCSFLNTIFDNVAVWDDSNNPEPMWKFKPLNKTECVGEAFGKSFSTVSRTARSLRPPQPNLFTLKLPPQRRSKRRPCKLI